MGKKPSSSVAEVKGKKPKKGKWVPAKAVSKMCIEACNRAYHASALAEVLTWARLPNRFITREMARERKILIRMADEALCDLLKSLTEDLDLMDGYARKACIGRMEAGFPGGGEAFHYDPDAGADFAAAAANGTLPLWCTQRIKKVKRPKAK